MQCCRSLGKLLVSLTPCRCVAAWVSKHTPPYNGSVMLSRAAFYKALQAALDGMHNGFWADAAATAAPDSQDLGASLCSHALAALHGLSSGNRPWERSMISPDGDQFSTSISSSAHDWIPPNLVRYNSPESLYI